MGETGQEEVSYTRPQVGAWVPREGGQGWVCGVLNEILLCSLVDVLGGRHTPGGMASTPNRRGKPCCRVRGETAPPTGEVLKLRGNPENRYQAIPVTEWWPERLSNSGYGQKPGSPDSVSRGARWGDTQPSLWMSQLVRMHLANPSRPGLQPGDWGETEGVRREPQRKVQSTDRDRWGLQSPAQDMCPRPGKPGLQLSPTPGGRTVGAGGGGEQGQVCCRGAAPVPRPTSRYGSEPLPVGARLGCPPSPRGFGCRGR